MSEQGNGTPADTGDSAGAGAAAASGAGEQRKTTLPASVTQRFSELSRARKIADQRAADERVRREALEAEVAQLRAQLSGGEEGDAGAQGGRAGRGAVAPMSQEQLERVAEDLANRKLTNIETARAVSRIEAAGRKVYENFDEAMGQFELVGGFTPSFFAAVSRLDNAHDVLYSLAGDLDRAAELMALDPVSQGLELARLAPSIQRSGQQMTRATEPIESLNGRAPGIDKNPDDMDNDEWFAWRDRQISAARRGQ